MPRMEVSSTAVALASEHPDVRRAVQLVGQILAGSVTSRTTLDGFLHATLGRSGSDLVCDSRKLSSIGHVTVGLAVAALIDRFDPQIGPGDDDEPPTWGHVKIGEQHLAPPSALSAYFAAGKLAPAPLVVRLTEQAGFSDEPRLQVYTSPADRADGVAALEAIMADAEGAKNLFRRNALSATERNGLVLEVTELPALTRANVIVPDSVWSEIDLNVAAVTTHRELMTKLGLGVRRGVLLAGPPGVGKTVISQVIAQEMLGAFTVMIVDARAGKSALAGVYKEAHTLGPTLIVLEDLDLIVGDRRNSFDTRALSEFLAVMDTDPSAPILTLASTNDLTALDAASIRTARFDSIIEVGYPDRDAAAKILSTYLRGVSGGDNVDAQTVAARFGSEISGADIREIVRRTVLADGEISEAGLIGTVQSGRFKPKLPQGNYL
ncbi:cell division protein [Mycobacterium kyorinense]|uniref:Cell division protein n=1 Tax=Mycobacterium kyorinense TaxID=487514 RepID=A0A1A2ZL26_9MYCO|nr:ATP-binding protein [Mycobacterium kyorinense]OBI49786.1 cell division protein [Mycobacterium kyorinense]